MEADVHQLKSFFHLIPVAKLPFLFNLLRDEGTLFKDVGQIEDNSNDTVHSQGM